MKWLKSSGKKCRDLNEKLIHHLIIPTSNQNLENGECLWGNVSIQNWSFCVIAIKASWKVGNLWAVS